MLDLHIREVHIWALFCDDCAKDATQHTYSCYIRGKKIQINWILNHEKIQKLSNASFLVVSFYAVDFSASVIW